MPYYYSSYGLRIASDISLPELVSAPVSDGTGAELVISVQATGFVRNDGSNQEQQVSIHRAWAQVSWPDVGQFTIEGGTRISLVPAPGMSAASLRPELLGPALAIALYQRDFTVLHCSAVAVPDRTGTWGVVAFLGSSGEGKSTLAAAFRRAGYRLFADDYLAIPPLTRDDTPPFVASGFPALRLGENSLAAIGADVSALPPLYEGQQRATKPRHEARYVQQVEDGFASESLPLRCLYVLERNRPETRDVQSELLTPGRAMPLLLQNLYCAGLVGSEETSAMFLRCGELAARVPVRALRRPTDLARLAEAVAQVLHDNF